MSIPDELATVPILQLHDRNDNTIPWQGGMTEDGWIYESLTTVLAGWARNHTCKFSRMLAGVNTPYDGGNVNLRCHEYKEC